MPVPSTQPDPTLEVIAGRNTFRINQVVDSGGAIFEVDTSILNAYVGPNSDFSQYDLTYYDPQRASGLNQTRVASDTPFAGRIDALLRTTIPATGQVARINATTANNYAPGGPTLNIPGPVTAEVTLIPPEFDLIFAIGPIDNPPVKRADKNYYFPDPDVGGGETSFVQRFIAVPTYGRASVNVIADYPDAAADQAQLLINAYAFDFLPGASLGQENFIQNVVIGQFSPEAKTLSYTAGQVGYHDYLVLELARYQLVTNIWQGSPTTDPTVQISINVSDRT